MQHSETTTVLGVETAGHPTMRWSAIFGGWLVATGIASLLYAGGLALGFTAFDPYHAEASAQGIGIGTAAWIVLTWAVALFNGGMFASWFDGRSDQTIGTLHGITVWGLSVAAGGLLLATGLTQVIQGGAAIVGGAASAGAAAGTEAARMSSRSPASGASADAVTGLQAQLTARVAQSGARSAVPQPAGQAAPADSPRAGVQPDRENMAAAARALMKGQNDTARALLAANPSMSQAEIDQTLQGLAPQVEKYKADVKAAADAAARYSAMAMWVVFFSGLIALVTAGLGGWMGAGHIHRVHHLRRYESSIPRPL